MQFNIVGDSDPLLHVNLAAGEHIFAESNALVSCDAHLSITGTVQGGMLNALARKLVNGESFFTQTLQANEAGGDALLAPALPGEIQVLEIGPAEYMLNDGVFLAAESSVDITTEMQSLGKAFFADTGGLFLMRARGRGKLAIAGFGHLNVLTVTPGNDVLIDNKHVVAWDAGLRYQLQMASQNANFLSKVARSMLSGEMLVTRFSGNGRVVIRSRNPAALAAAIAPPSR